MTKEMVDGVLRASFAIPYGGVINCRAIFYGITRRKVKEPTVGLIFESQIPET
jgi:hypothetical protein